MNENLSIRILRELAESNPDSPEAAEALALVGIDRNEWDGDAARSDVAEFVAAAARLALRCRRMDPPAPR